MNILPISIAKLNSNRDNNRINQTPTGFVVPRYNNQPAHDTVTFTAAKLSTGLRDTWARQMPRFERIGMTWLDTWDAVAAKLRDKGVNFVREMFEATVVKTADSQELKALRHKTLERRDLIRTTVFVSNPYNLKLLFNNIISELGLEARRGYYVAPIFQSIGDLIKRGYAPLEEEKIVTEILAEPLTKPNLAKVFKKLEKITYEYPFKHYTSDFGSISEAEQLRYDTLKVNRLKYNFDDTKKILLELSDSKKPVTREDFIRILKSIKKEVPDVDVRLNPEILKKTFNQDTLPEDFKYCIGDPHGTYEDIQVRVIRDYDKVSPTPIFHEYIVHFGPTYNVNAALEHKIYESLRLFETLNVDTTAPTFNSPASRINGCIDSIQKLIRREISEKLLEHGKNVDFYGMDDTLNINLSDDVIKEFNRKFEWLQQELENHYQAAQKAAKKGSRTSYRTLGKDYEADKALVAKIKGELDAIIKEYNHKYGLKDNG